MIKINLNSFVIKNITKFLLPCFLVMILADPCISQRNSLYASDNINCNELLDTAENYYYDGKIDQAINLVMQCLKDKNIDTAIKIRAFKILVRTQLAREDEQSAKNFVNKILDLEPTYQPTIEEEIPLMVNIVSEVKKEREQLTNTKQQSSSNWIWYGASGAVIFTVIALVASGGGNEKKEDKEKILPTPPVFP